VPDDLRTASALGDLAAVERWLTSGPSLATTAAAGFDFAGPPAYFPARATATDDRTVLDESLTWASRCGQVSAMARLVDAGADVNGNPYRGTPLLWAAFNDGLEPARWLLDHGADPDLRHDFGGSEHGRGATAMHLAAQYGSLRVLRLLLERGADPTIRDEAFGGTALDWARHDEQHEAVAILQAVSGSSL
jgi:hypothetical protein